MKFLVIFTMGILFVNASVNACIFQSSNTSGASPFWESKRIEVCFMPAQARQSGGAGRAPNPLDGEYIENYQRNRTTVEQTLKSQINERTDFDLHGFQTCDESDSDKQMIRIDLNGFGGGAGAMAMSVGPRSARSIPNVDITTANSGWPGGVKPSNSSGELPERVRVFSTPKHISWVSLHETLHLLGMHHTEYWDSDVSEADEEVDRVIQFGSEPDPDSMMTRRTRNFNTNDIAELSTRDVTCLNHIANRSIMQFPQRRAFVRSDQNINPSYEMAPHVQSLPAQRIKGATTIE